MQAYWNKLALDRPPTTSWTCATSDFDFNGFQRAIDNIKKELEMQTVLRTEAALLSRLIYRMKSKLRSDKGLKNMEKVNRALLNYLRLSLETEYMHLSDNAECNDNVLVLPSRQMLQYVLVRTQGFAKLMCRIENVAEKSGDFFRIRINAGQAWNMSLVAYAVISRIWLLSRYLTKKCCNWYSKMYKYHDKLRMIGVSWLPETYCFPEDLKAWLYVPWINESAEKVPDKESLSDGIFNLISQYNETEKDSEFVAEDTRDAHASSHPSMIKCTEIGPLPGKISASKDPSQNKIKPHLLSVNEIGKRINRDAFVANFAKQCTKVQASKKRKIVEGDDSQVVAEKRLKKDTKILRCENTKTCQVPSIDRIKTREEVMEFLSLESYPGLEKLKWKIMKKNVQKLLIKLNKCESSSDIKKRDVLLKKIIRSIRECIN